MKLCVLDQGELFGGAERFTLDLLASLPKSRHRPLLVHHVQADPAYVETASRIPFCEVLPTYLPALDQKKLPSYFTFLRSAWSLYRLLRPKKIDLLQTNTVRSHIVGSMAAKYLGIPVVWVVHDVTFPPAMLRRFVRYPSAIVCVSEFVRDYIHTHGGTEAAIKTRICPNGIDLDALHAAPATLRPLTDIDGHPFSFLPHKRYVGLIGRIDTWKGQDVFLHAIEYLQKEYPQHEQVEYVIVGDVTETTEEHRAYYRELRRLADQGTISHVTFLGRQEIGQVLPHLDILVHASTEPEPFGRTIIEAWAYGVPVIATRLGAPASVVTYGKTGLLVEPREPRDLAQKISLLLEDHHLVDTLRMHGKKVVRASFDIPLVVDAYVSLWDEVHSRHVYAQKTA